MTSKPWIARYGKMNGFDTARTMVEVDPVHAFSAAHFLSLLTVLRQLIRRFDH
jgi:hypothetical protein